MSTIPGKGLSLNFTKRNFKQTKTIKPSSEELGLSTSPLEDEVWVSFNTTVDFFR